MRSKLCSIGVLERRGDSGSDSRNLGRRESGEVRESFTDNSLLYGELMFV